jgi:hypothetical protein
MIRILFLDQMLRHTRWNVDARPYYLPKREGEPDAIPGLPDEV